MKQKNSVLWLYSPSNMDVRDLEGIFVAREPLAQQLVSEVTHFTQGQLPKHQLLLGPRGMGKTHLISIIFARTSKLREEGKLTVSWLNEDVSGVYDLLSFYLQVAQCGMDSEDYQRFHATLAAENHQGRPKQADIAEKLLEESFSQKRLLVIMENGQQSLETIGKDGQWQLREFLGRSPWLMMLASTTKRFKGMTKAADAFFGFFNLVLLDDLTADEAMEMMQKVATLTGDDEVLARLKTPEGAAEVRTVFDFAGGNPRIWAIFADLLNLQNLESVITWLQEAVDALTPYYQERFWGAHSHQQRAVLAELLMSDYALQPKTIADKLLMPPNQVSAVLNAMVDEAVLVRKRLGRESYYTLREPLMRIAHQVKESKGKPIRFIVQILRRIHSAEDLFKYGEITTSQIAKSYIEACRNSFVRELYSTSMCRAALETNLPVWLLCWQMSVGHELCLGQDYLERWERFAELAFGSDLGLFQMLLLATAVETILRTKVKIGFSEEELQGEISSHAQKENIQSVYEAVKLVREFFAPLQALSEVNDQLILRHEGWTNGINEVSVILRAWASEEDISKIVLPSWIDPLKTRILSSHERITED